jgi:hypothetical protein
VRLNFREVRLLRARLRWANGGAQEEQQEAASRSGQTGARGDAARRVRGVDGQTAALTGADQEDGRADRRDGVQTVRADGGGDRDCGRKQPQVNHLFLFIDLIMMA